MTTGYLTAAEVDEAHTRIRPFLDHTRLAETRTTAGRRAYLKLECEQPTGSFKVRGALSNLSARGPSPAGFVTASAGNHGLGVAWAARRLDRKERVTIFVPASAPLKKREKLATFAIDLRIEGETFDDAERAAREFERESGATFIHAYDDPLTAAGQGTLAPEVVAAIGAPGTIVVPVGGGGLLSGIAAWLKERHRATRIVAVQPEASPSFSESLRLGRALLEYPAGPTLADGLAGGIGKLVFDHRQLIDETMNVPEDAMLDAVRHLHRDLSVTAEASGAITLAAASLARGRWPDPVVCVITGGNIDEAVLRGLLD